MIDNSLKSFLNLGYKAKSSSLDALNRIVEDHFNDAKFMTHL